MFLYILLFLNSCLSTPSRQISSTGSYQAWYAGFDKQLQPEDSSWSPKLYYSPALDNFRKFGTYTHKEENELRSYLKDRFNPNGNSLYPALEKLLLVLFPSPNGSLSIASASNTNLNTFISRLPTGDIQKNLLTKEIALAQVLNIVYKILSLPINEKSKDNINTLRKKLYPPITIIFSDYYTENKTTFDKTNLHLPDLIKSFFNPLLNFIEQDRSNSEEKELIQHAFMKWALMHVGITNSNSVVTLIDNLSFFKKVPKDNNENNLAQLSESEKLFQEAGIGFPDPENIYLANAPFENGNTYAFNQEGEQTQEFFPDCTETTLRHFFNYALKKEGKFQVLDKFHPKLKEYYKEATDAKVLGTDIVSRTAWNKVVSHIPGAEYYKNNNELKSNISNIFHVIEYLLTNKPKDFQELTTDAMVQEKFKNIKVILDKIKPISLAQSSSMDNQYIFNNFFIINIRYNAHGFATVLKNDQNNKPLAAIDSKNLNLLEYSLLANFFPFKNLEFNNYKNIIPFFQSSISDITTILNFFEQSNKLSKEYLDTCSSYIGRVLSSALWEDYNIVEEIYNDENLINIIKTVEKSEDILQGIQLLSLESGEYNHLIGPLSYLLETKLLFLKKLKKIFINNRSFSKIQDLAQTIFNNNESIKEIKITKLDQVNELTNPILSCTHLKNLQILKSPFNITSRIGDLIELEVFVINTQEKKTIPTWLLKLTKLRQLDLKDNNFSQSIPLWLSQLINLEQLYLSDNNLTGEIPDTLKSLTKLTILSLCRNNLSGLIPKWLGELIDLKRLYLHDNKLTGSIPKELGELKSLNILNLSENQLTGSIPKELGNLTKLESLFLNDNELTGSIPKELGNLTELNQYIALYLTENKLTGFIPKNLEKHKDTINPQFKIIQENGTEKKMNYNLPVDYK